MNRPKLLYILFMKSSQNKNFDFSIHDRKGQFHCLMTAKTSASTLNSIQKPSLLSNDNNINNNDNISDNDLIKKPQNDLRNDDNDSNNSVKSNDSNCEKEISKVFSTNAFTIYDAMHSFLMKNKACVSSPISAAPMIMMRQEGGNDIKLFFTCRDQNPNEVSAVLELYPDPSSIDLSVQIMEHIEKCFITPPIEV